MTNYTHLGENPIRFSFSGHEEIQIFVKACHEFLPSKFWQKGDSHYTMNPEFCIIYSFWTVYVDLCTKLGWESIYDKHNKNTYFFVTTEPNRMEFLPKCMIITCTCSYIFIILKQYSDWCTILKAIDAESLIVFFFLTIGICDKICYLYIVKE